MTAQRTGWISRLLGHPQPQAWSIDGGVLRFERDFHGGLGIQHGGTRVTINEGARIGRGTRVHLLGGTLEIATGAALGESVDLRPAHAISIGAGAVVEDFACIQSDTAEVSLGQGVRIGRFTHVWGHRGPVRVGDATTIGASCCFIGTGAGIDVAARCDFTHGVTLDSAGGSIVMAAGSGVGPNSVLYGHGGLRIGAGVAIAGLTMIVPGNHRFSRSDQPIRAQGVDPIPIEIGDDVWIGGGAVVLGGVVLGKGCVVGAGSVVRGRVEAGSVVAGVPSRSIGTRAGEPR